MRAARTCAPDIGLPASPLESLAAWFVAGEAEPPPAALTALLGRAAPPADGSDGDTARSIVIGHPAESPADGVVICLGRPTVRRWLPTTVVTADGGVAATCVAAAATTRDPVTIAWDRRGDRPVWLRIAGAAAADGPVTADPARCVDAA